MGEQKGGIHGDTRQITNVSMLVCILHMVYAHTHKNYAKIKYSILSVAESIFIS